MSEEPENAAESAEAPEKSDKESENQAKPAASRGEKAKTTTTSNPLGEEQRGFNNAFWQGQRFLSPEMSRRGSSAVIGQADIQELQIGDRTQVFIGQSVSRTLGSIQEEDLAWVRRRYLKVSDYQRLATTLTSRRVLLLRGQPGTGRSTTALHLLDRVTTARVLRVEGSRVVSSPEMRDFPEKNAGYVAQLSKEDASAMTVEKLDRLRDVLASRSSFCVLVSDTDPRDDDLFGGYACVYTPPEPAAVLKMHSLDEILADDPPDMENRLHELLDAEWVAEALGPCPRPQESVRVAIHLAEHARGATTREDVEHAAAAAVRVQIADWFAPLRALSAGAEHDEALHLAAFRVALAVLNESPYHLVATAAGMLGSMLIEASADRETRHASLFSDDPEGRLPALRAVMLAGTTTFGPARVSTSLLAFHDERYPQAILRYVWENHHQMATTTVKWLAELCTDTRPLVWVRAAQAIGFLGSLDFPEIYTKAIQPAVRSASDEVDDELDGGPGSVWQRRLAAAVALDQAAQYENLRAAIRGRLRSWRKRGGFGERWTAAATYGFVLGGQHVEESLEELRVLGTPAELQPPLAEEDPNDHFLTAIAGFSIAKLFAFGEVEVVLEHLRRWIDDQRASLRGLAKASIRELMNFYGFELDHLSVAVGRGQSTIPEQMKTWPLLLSVHVQEPAFTESIADLIRQLLRRDGDTTAHRFLGKWIRQSERDSALLDVLVGFVPHIIKTEGDERRLDYLLRRMSLDWADPLRLDVANRLLEAIASNRVGSLIA